MGTGSPSVIVQLLPKEGGGNPWEKSRVPLNGFTPRAGPVPWKKVIVLVVASMFLLALTQVFIGN